MMSTAGGKLGLTVGQKIVLIIGGPLLLQLGISFAIGTVLNQVERLASYEYASKERLGRTNWLGFVLSASIVSAVGKVFDPGDTIYAKTYNWCRQELKKELPPLLALFSSPKNNAGDNSSVRRLNGIVTGIEKRLDQFDEKNSEAPDKRVTLLMKSSEMHVLWNSFPQLRRDLLEGERNPFAVGYADVGDTRNLLKTCIYIGAGANILMAFAMAVLFGISLAKRIRVLTDNTRRLAKNEQLQEPIGGSDELAELDDTFHSMARALGQARQKERAIFENTADVICVLGPDGTFRQTSPAAKAAWGYEPHELEDRSWQMVVRDEERERSRLFIKEAMDEESPVAVDLEMNHRDGRTLEFRWSGSWSREHQSLFCVAHDVSEQKRIEKLKREFVQVVSHDLRSPLTSLQAFLVMIQDGVYGSVPERVNSKARQSSMDLDRLIRLINNLLDLDKLDAGKMQLLMTSATSTDLIDRAVISVEAMAEMSDVTLVSSGEPLTLVCDDMQIVQVLVNLISNAIKFSPPQGKVTIEAERIGNEIEFRVVDQGRGVPEEFRETIFDRFKQVKAEDWRSKRGTGLGLAICKAVVDAHGGSIGVLSELSKGSTFWFRLPLEPRS